MYYTIYRNCLNNIYVTLPGTILHIFSNSDKIERILAKYGMSVCVLECMFLCVFVVYIIKSEKYNKLYI